MDLTRVLVSRVTMGVECRSPHLFVDVATRLHGSGRIVTIKSVTYSPIAHMELLIDNCNTIHIRQADANTNNTGEAWFYVSSGNKVAGVNTLCVMPNMPLQFSDADGYLYSLPTVFNRVEWTNIPLGKSLDAIASQLIGKHLTTSMTYDATYLSDSRIAETVELVLTQSEA